MKNGGVKLAVAICILCAAMTIAARENCSLANKTASVALNLRLGMSPAEARAQFGKSLKIKNKTKGDYRFFQNYVDKSPPANLNSVRALYLRFFDGRMYQAEIFYEKSFASSLEDFKATIAREFSFANDVWQVENLEHVALCGTESIAADYILNPRFELTDETTLQKAIAAKKN